MLRRYSSWYKVAIKKVVQLLRWLIPGIGVKRWFLVFLAGTTMIGLGLAVFLLDMYRSAPNSWLTPILAFLSLRFLSRPLRIIIYTLLGFALIGIGLWRLNRSLLVPFLRPGQPLVDQVADFRRKGRGPKIVAIGGGHGIATVLRGMKNYSNNLTAVVSVADDGGSSGELRRSTGILPPGDIRNCLAALSDDEALLAQLFQYRFGEESGLGGHSFGNLFILALTDITGSFEEAISESGQALSVNGKVLPATLHNVKLVADVHIPIAQTEVRVEGESHIPKAAGQVRRIWLEPDHVSAFPPVIQALLNADIIVIGPGSLYTSIIPNLLVPDLLQAIVSSKALKVFVTNLTSQMGETELFTLHDHIQTLEEFAGKELVNVIICNSWYDATLENGLQWVRIDNFSRDDPRVYAADIADHNLPDHHDATKLAQVLMDLFNERTGPLAKEQST